MLCSISLIIEHNLFSMQEVVKFKTQVLDHFTLKEKVADYARLCCMNQGTDVEWPFGRN